MPSPTAGRSEYIGVGRTTHAEAVGSRPAPGPWLKVGPTKSPIVKRPLMTPCVEPSAVVLGIIAGWTRWSTAPESVWEEMPSSLIEKPSSSAFATS